MSEYFCIRCKTKDVTLNKYVAWLVCNRCGHEFSKKEFVEYIPKEKDDGNQNNVLQRN